MPYQIESDVASCDDIKLSTQEIYETVQLLCVQSQSED
jgi:hypothetical protein